MTGRNSVVVAHRLSTIVRADMICVMADGRIVEQGAFAELIEKVRGAFVSFSLIVLNLYIVCAVCCVQHQNGRFAALWRAQQLGNNDDEDQKTQQPALENEQDRESSHRPISQSQGI